ncbi:MAG TPA: CBS domain-containing protein [Stellaceae bacterium]|nr:CBS domain-containing protein [Stellaceae bacterium]
MKAADVMRHRVVTVTPETTVADAAKLMLHHGVSGLPVIDKAGAVIGMVTEGDLLRRAETGTEKRRPHWLEFILGPGPLAVDYVRAHGRKVGEVMTRRVIVIAPETPLEEVVHSMERHRIKRLPVLDHGRLVGIVSRASLLPVLAHLAAAAPTAAPADAELRRRVLTAIEQQPWAIRATIDAVVQDGIVDLHGVILDERERQALCVVVENVPGVKAVRDHLAWVEPVSGMVVEVPDEDAHKNAT